MDKITRKKYIQSSIESVVNKLQTIKKAMEDANETSQNETKSSMGDKYETTRSMMQIELENLSKQYTDAEKLYKILLGVSVEKQFDKVAFGSIVATNEGVFFVAAAVGKISSDAGNFIAISPVSPIAQVLIGCTIGETVKFNGRNILIEGIY